MHSGSQYHGLHFGLASTVACMAYRKATPAALLLSQHVLLRQLHCSPALDQCGQCVVTLWRRRAAGVKIPVRPGDLVTPGHTWSHLVTPAEASPWAMVLSLGTDDCI